MSTPNTGMPLVALIVNPVRPHRVEPRVKKRRPKVSRSWSNPGTYCVSSWSSKNSKTNLMPFGSSSLLVIQGS